jgi:hypothetical protein
MKIKVGEIVGIDEVNETYIIMDTDGNVHFNVSESQIDGLVDDKKSEED